MNTYEPAPSLAHIIRHEAQALISAINDGDDIDTAGTLATITELVGEMQRRLNPELVATVCSGNWAYNGALIYPEHYRYHLDSTGHITSLTPVGETGDETA